MFYKRLVALLFSAIFVVLFSACGGNISNDGEREILSGFSVHFLDVGQGDAIFIKLPDGKSVLIDCGEPTEQNEEYIKEFLNDYDTKTIDYFIITHPDTDHIGNAPSIINSFTVKELYLSDINENAYKYFDIYKEVVELANKNQIRVRKSDNYKVIKGEEYFFVFLTPEPKSFFDSSYVGVNGSLIPSEEDVNNISPIIYFECLGLRFVFTGDAMASQERLALENLSNPVLKSHYENSGVSINLYNVDFLKVAHHGAEGSTCDEFLEVIKPKNAIISVGGGNSYGHPNSSVLTRLFNANPDMNLYRTDRDGTVSICLDGNLARVITDRSL